MTAPADLTAAALDLAAHGWHVFPLRPLAKVPAVRQWEARATTDPDRIRRCWSAGPFNIGVATGPSALVVVDLDRPKPGEAPPDGPGIVDGLDVLAALAEERGGRIEFDTYAVRTRRGGLHLYYAAPDGAELRNTSGTLGWLIDTRAYGGYVVGPGSVVELEDGGGRYATVHDAPAAPLPAWLADALAPAAPPPAGRVVVPLATDRHGAYLRRAVVAEVERVTGSPPHGHNTALYQASTALGQLVAGGELAATDVTAWLVDAAATVGQPEREAERTIASGLRAGAKRPRSVAA
ncbi:MAG TPA: bifunctional DNA primase/polymerase [Streptosporangiaceae bacterium]